jgi:hypothetical protein
VKKAEHRGAQKEDGDQTSGNRPGHEDDHDDEDEAENCERGRARAREVEIESVRQRPQEPCHRHECEGSRFARNAARCARIGY